MKNCYNCRRPDYFASSYSEDRQARFRCPLIGFVDSDEIGADFECADWLDQDDHPTKIFAGGIPPFLAYAPSGPEVVGALLAAAWRIEHGAGQAGGA